MGSKMAGSVLLRHAGGASRRLFSATATSPAAAAARPFLAGGEGVQGSWVRLMSTSAASQAKDEAAKAAAAAAAGKGDGEKKEVAVNSYWGIEQSQKLVREDGTEWKWSCFRVRTRTRLPPLLRSVSLISIRSPAIGWSLDRSVDSSCMIGSVIDLLRRV
jgi:hypothetical protein